MVSRRTILQTVGASATVTGLAGCIGGGGGGGPDEVKVGVAFPLEGPVFKLFRSGVPSYKMAVEEINNDGGVQVGDESLQINLVDEDSGCAPDVAQTAITKLATQNNVDILTGPLCSGGVLGSMSLSEEYELPQLGIGSNPQILEQRHPYFWHMHETSAQRAEVMAKFHSEVGSSVVLMAINNSFGQGAVSAYEDHYSDLGVNVKETIFFESGSTQFQTQLTKAKQADPDVVHFVAEEHEQVLGLIRQSQNVGLKETAQLTGEPEWAGISLAEEVDPEALRGWHSVTTWSPHQDNQAVQDYISAFNDKYPDLTPGFIGANMYDCIYFAKAAIENAGSVDRTAINDAIKDTSWGPGAYGGRTWQFDEQGQAEMEPFLVRWDINNGEPEQTILE